MRCVLTLLACLLMVQTSWATIINVPVDYASISQAVDVALDGDTVLVAPGNYTDRIDFGVKGITLLSSNGPEYTQLTPQATDFLINVGATGSISAMISGFSVSQGRASNLIKLMGAEGAVVENNRFYDLTIDESLILCNSSNVVIRKNVFAFNTVGHACIGLLGDENQVINNTFYHNHRGFYSQGAGNIAINNIVAYNDEYGIYGSFNGSIGDLDYNCVIGNSPDYDYYASAGPHSLSVDPQLESPDAYDFSLSADSPCIDAGNPAEEYLDEDGTRSDIGALSYIHHYPLAVQVKVGDLDYDHVLDSLPTISWQFNNNDDLPQTACEIEVGTDLDFSVAEMWNSGEITTSDHGVQYAGSPLQRNTIYFGRIRVSDENGFGGWTVFRFHRNSLPEPPSPYSPEAFTAHSILDVVLVVTNGSDAEGDPRTYDFVVYSDVGLTDIAAEISGLPEENSETSTGRLSGLQGDQQYWWRCRIFDGLEFSDWSQVSAFQTRNPRTYRVPNDFDFIPQAIDFAVHQDTIMVEPGAYNEPIDLKGKSIVIKSAQGPEVTTLTTAGAHPNTFILLNTSDVASAELSGFTIISEASQYGIEIPDGSLVRIDNNRLIGARLGNEVIWSKGASVLIDHNVFSDCLVGHACIGVTSGVTSIINNTFFNNTGGFFSQLNYTIAKNNIIDRSSSYGISGFYSYLNYNDVYDNEPNFAGGAFAGGYSISQDPLFRNELEGDFQLMPNSPCIDMGDPIPTYNDPNGTRNDMGAYPFDEIAPYPFSLLEPQSQLDTPFTDLRPTFSWEPTTTNDSTDVVYYTLQVAPDSLFSFVMEADSLTEMTAQAPEQLDWGTRYWWRVLASGPLNLTTASSEVGTFRTMTLGDANNSARLDISDAVFLINYVFANGPAPQPAIAGNLNCDDRINMSDIVYLVNYMFISGPKPCSDWPTASPTVDKQQIGELQLPKLR